VKKKISKIRTKRKIRSLVSNFNLKGIMSQWRILSLNTRMFLCKIRPSKASKCSNKAREAMSPWILFLRRATTPKRWAKWRANPLRIKRYPALPRKENQSQRIEELSLLLDTPLLCQFIYQFSFCSSIKQLKVFWT
jgi:hypothetical protein